MNPPYTPTDEFQTQSSTALGEQAPPVYEEDDRADGSEADDQLGVRPYLYDGKEKIRRQLDETAKALRQSGSELPNDSSAGLIRMSADTLERVGNYLGERDLDQLIDEAQEAARRRPWWFIGGAFVVGMAAARFLKSSGPVAPRRPHADGQSQTGSTTYAAGSSGATDRPTTTV